MPNREELTSQYLKDTYIHVWNSLNDFSKKDLVEKIMDDMPIEKMIEWRESLELPEDLEEEALDQQFELHREDKLLD